MHAIGMAVPTHSWPGSKGMFVHAADFVSLTTTFGRWRRRSAARPRQAPPRFAQWLALSQTNKQTSQFQNRMNH
jgi:hypothetical protein